MTSSLIYPLPHGTPTSTGYYKKSRRAFALCGPRRGSSKLIAYLMRCPGLLHPRGSTELFRLKFHLHAPV